MFNFTPPSVANCNIEHSQNACNIAGGTHHCACRLFLYGIVALFVALVIWSGYKTGVRNAVPEPVEFSRALYFNGDSLRHYARLAYMEEDPKALFVTGAAAYLKEYAGLPDTLPTIPFDEASILLLRSSELGNEDAVSLIRCLDYHQCWSHSLPKQLDR